MGDWKGRKKHNYTEHPQKIVPLPWNATGRTILTHVGITDPKKTTAEELGLYMAGAKRMDKEGEQ